MTTERPLLLAGPMVRATLEDRKTQTRRVVKPQPFIESGPDGEPGPLAWYTNKTNTPKAYGVPGDMIEHCPYGQPGDLLWVRQPWAAFDLDWRWMDDWCEAPQFENRYMRTPETTCDAEPKDFKWRSARFMPKRAAQLWLRVKGVRVEPVQNITPDGSIAEGAIMWGTVENERRMFDSDGKRRNTPLAPSVFDGTARGIPSLVNVFAELWDSINAKRGFGWETNPWVWVVEFERTARAA